MDPMTLKTLVEKYQFSAEELNKKVTENDLDKLALSHGKKWRRLPPHLGLSKSVKDDIDSSHQDERDKRYDFFIFWKERRGSEATFKVLITSLLSIECQEDADYACQILESVLPKRSKGTRTGKSFATTSTQTFPDHFRFQNSRPRLRRREAPRSLPTPSPPRVCRREAPRTLPKPPSRVRIRHSIAAARARAASAKKSG